MDKLYKIIKKIITNIKDSLNINKEIEFQFPPPREITPDIANKILNESRMYRREFEKITRSMEQVYSEDSRLAK